MTLDNTDEQFRTEVELSDYLGISVSTLRLWRRNGKGPNYIRYDRLIRYRNSDVESWLKEQTVVPGA